LIELEHELIVSFRREAARREMPVTRLIHESLNTIVTDQLTTANSRMTTKVGDG
jgi:hypothetical protein